MTPAVDTTEAASSSSSLPMAAINDDTRRSASIASLLGPAGGRGATGSINALNANRGLSTAPSSSSRLPSQSTHVHSDRHSFRPADNNHLLSLSRLAAEMEPVSPSDPSPGLPAPPASAFNRTRSVPVNSRSVPISSSDRGGGASCSGSRDSLRLGVAGGSTKRLSRTKSAFGNMRRAVAAAASNMASTASHSSANSSENTNSHSNTTGPSNVLRTIQNPTNSGGNLSRRALGTSSKATSTTNSLDSLANSGSNGMGHHPTPGLGTTNHNNINNNNNTNSIAIPKTEATAAVMLTNLPRLHASRLRMEGGTNHSVFQAAAARLADAPRTPSMTPRSIHHINASAAMEMDVVEPNSNSHHHNTNANQSYAGTGASSAPVSAAGGGTGGRKPRTTPDAKRAQNRESAKRFRVAQKKRWADLQDLVAQKEREIARLTDMLQKVTDARQPVQHRTTSPPGHTSSSALHSSGVSGDGGMGMVGTGASSVPVVGGGTAANTTPTTKLDSLVMAELDLFVKLVTSPGLSTTSSSHACTSGVLEAPARNIGSLHRILVATTDGSITGVRHLNRRGIINPSLVSGGMVGQYLWDDVHDNDSLQLRFTVLHAGKFADDMVREPLVFAYRRGVTRRSHDGDSSTALLIHQQQNNNNNNNNNNNHHNNDDGNAYIRMKGCVHPVLTSQGAVAHLLLAEFVET